MLFYLKEPKGSLVVKWAKIFKTVKTIEIQSVKPSEVSGNV